MGSEVLWLLLAGAAGVLLGIFYFGGLWLTILQLERIHQPVLLFAASFLGRTALVLVGFYLAADGHLDRLAACLVGFFLPRLFFVRWAQAPKKGL
jgi:F1F0 ATPase subunit 2